MSAEKLLSRLERVKQTGEGRWLACCPAHNDKSPSLSIRETGDGTVLLHCFSHQCGAASIMEAVGLTLVDLFPDRADHHRPAGKPRIPSQDVLSAIVTEAWIVALAARQVLDGFDLAEADVTRLEQAAERIRSAARLGGVSC
jgi:DNA primase